MHLQVIKDDYYNDIIRNLNDKVPEFQSIFSEDEGVYPILGEFGRFLITNIDNEMLAMKCFEFINQALNIGKNETEDVIVIQVFQPIYDDELLKLKSKNYLDNKAMKVFLEFEKKYKDDI